MQRGGAGLTLAVLSAATFGTAGALGSGLIDAGWTPAAAVTARIVLATVALTAPALRQLRGRWGLLRRNARVLAGYGLAAVAGAQLCYFNAVAHLSVGVALLLEYLGTLLVVGWLWIRYGQRPQRLTAMGGAVAILGLVLVLDLAGSHRLSPVGVLWGLGAATGLAVYFIVSASHDEPLPPLVMAWGGMACGAVGLLLLGAVRLLPMQASTHDVLLLHRHVSWLVPVLGLALVAAALAYVAGIAAARLLGARLAAFIGLSEVLFAVLFAWLLLGQAPTGLQLVGGSLIVIGVALVRLDELRRVPAGPLAGG